MSSAVHLVSLLEHWCDESTVGHGHSQSHVDLLIVGDAVAIRGAGCREQMESGCEWERGRAHTHKR